MIVTPDMDKLVFEYEGSLGFTILQNIFIERFMPAANGSYVKVYLAGLKRCFGHKDQQWASHKTIAEEAGVGCSISTVRRSWKYWESVGLVRIFPRFLKDVNNPGDYSTQKTKLYRIPTSSIIRFVDLQKLAQEIAIKQALAEAMPQTSAASDGEGLFTSEQGGMFTGEQRVCSPVNTEEIQLNNNKREELQDKTAASTTTSQETDSDVMSGQVDTQNEVSKDNLEKVSTLYASLTKKAQVGKSDTNHLARLLCQYGLEDVMDALQETARSERIKVSFLRYAEGVLANWGKEGKNTHIYDIPNSQVIKTKQTFVKGSTAKRDPKEAQYYADYLKLEQALLDSMPAYVRL